MLDSLKTVDIISYGIVGEEVGEAGTPHLQGYIQLSRASTMSALMKRLKKAGIKCNLSVAKGTYEQNVKYCSKDGKVHLWGIPKAQGKRCDMADCRDMIKDKKTDEELVDVYPGQWIRYHRSFNVLRKMYRDKEFLAERKEEMQEMTLRDWQENAVEKLLRQDNREVLWVLDATGNSGKSFLASWLGCIKGAFEVTSGQTKDIAYAYEMQRIVVFDFSRQKEEYVNYGVIEGFKNGVLFSPKYESRTLRFKPAKVIVFSNWEPNYKMLSKDRWNVMTLSKETKRPWHYSYCNRS